MDFMIRAGFDPAQVSARVASQRAQIAIKEVMADVLTLMTACFLLESEVNAAVNAGIVNVVGDLLPVGVV